jgi:hypothetical protein
LGASIVHPEKKQVVPLAPEPIKNSDGSKKQDCEINAGKRFLNRIRQEHPKLEIVITADDLYLLSLALLDLICLKNSDEHPPQWSDQNSPATEC